jgi:beta-glucosidase
VDFKHVSLKNNVQNKVEFTIPKHQLRYINEQGKAIDYTGRLIVTVGSGQGVKLPENQYTISNIAL